MSISPSRLVIATRASRLALWQAHHVRDQLLALYPDCHVELLEMTTKGDRILDRTLSKIGGKGLFVKELETALLDGRADLAVHSLKDVPVELHSPFSLPVIMERDDPRDAFVSNLYDSLDAMPTGSVVGTSSLRRQAQIAKLYPDLVIKPLRGNLDTRLKKLNLGEYDAIILAAVGLKRLDLGHRIRSYLEVDACLPCAGQGALGIETLESRTELHRWLQPLACPQSTACSQAERAVSRVLGGSCQVPLGAYASVQGDTIHVQALVAEPDGSTILRAQGSGPVSEARDIGEKVAAQLLEKGAREILSRLLATDPAS